MSPVGTTFVHTCQHSLMLDLLCMCVCVCLSVRGIFVSVWGGECGVSLCVYICVCVVNCRESLCVYLCVCLSICV